MKKLILVITLILIIGCSNANKNENIKIIDNKLTDSLFEQIVAALDNSNENWEDILVDDPYIQNLADSLDMDMESAFRWAIEAKGGGCIPSLWFSPSKGEVAFIDEFSSYPEYGRPDSTYIIWLEPGDPEFRISKKFRFQEDEPYGIQYLGDGENMFNNPPLYSELSNNWEYDLIANNSSGPMAYNDTESFEELAEKNSVYFIATPYGNSVIMIMTYNGLWPEGREDGPTRNYYLKFKWKKVN